METCSFGERICGEQGYEVLDGSEQEEDEEDNANEEDGGCGDQMQPERFISATRRNLRDDTSSQGTINDAADES